MAFISTDSAEWRALKKLRELGLRSTDITNCEEYDYAELELAPIENKTADNNISDKAIDNPISPKDITFIPISTFVQFTEVSPDKGWRLCFHSLYNIETDISFTDNRHDNQTLRFYQAIHPSSDIPQLVSKSKSKTERGRRGPYKLLSGSESNFTLAKKRDEIFINRLTITEEELGASTWELLRSYLNNRGITNNSYVYTLSGIPHSTFNRLINNKKSQPNKETLFKIGIILRLTIDEIKELLESAGLTFKPSDKRDNIIKRCFEEEIFNIWDVNQCLRNNNVEEMEFGFFDRLNR
jgi:hypothetical protein